MINLANNKFFSVIRRVFESYLLVPVVFGYAFFCWYFNNSLLTVAGFVTVFALILIFAKNVNNIFALILYVSFFIKDIYSEGTPWTFYVIIIAVALIVLIAFIIKTLIVKKGEIKKGSMFPAIIVSSIAFMLGGVVGRFNILNFIITFAFSLALFVVYFIANNCTKNLGKYLAYVFMVGAIFITAQICVVKLRNGDLFNGYPYDEVFKFSAQTLNTAAIYLLLGIIGLFYLGFKKKYDIICFILSFVIVFGIFISCCRTVLAVTVPVMIAMFICMTIYSPKKYNFLWLFLAGVAVAIGVYLKFTAQIMDFIDMIVQKISRGLNGRETLWPWCIERFLEYPVFGYGFVADEFVPTIPSKTYIIMAHNTALQWLTSLGVLGTAFMSYFYIVKYKTFGKFNSNKIFYLLAILSVELTGVFDQAAAMDFFTHLVPLLLISGMEEKSETYITPAVH